VPIARLAKLECHAIGRSAKNGELAKVHCAMVQIADGSEVAQGVAASVALVIDVM
jgi:hypothetical protein